MFSCFCDKYLIWGNIYIYCILYLLVKVDILKLPYVLAILMQILLNTV